MVNSKTFDLTVNAFGDFVHEVFSGDDENQKYSDMLNMKALVGIRIIFMGKEFWMMSVLVVLYKKGIYISME